VKKKINIMLDFRINRLCAIFIT